MGASVREGAKKLFARYLRSGMTDAERKLWRHLRQRQIIGFRFRRQHPIGPYVVDFACLEEKLIVEVDGGQHLGSVNDVRRDAWFEEQGFRMLRFWNDDVLLRTDDVLAAIMNAFAPNGPHPNLPPLAGEGAKGSSTP